MKIVILAWGNWEQLWPLSRIDSPKQFNKLDTLNWESLFQKSLKRALHLTKKDNIFIVVSKDNFFHAEIQAEELWVDIRKENFIFQPSMKWTLPIISLAINKIGNENVLFLPSDQVIDDLDTFKDRVDIWLNNSKKWIILFWIKPKWPETIYGYIEKESNDEIFSKIINFHEKPSKEIAEKYVESKLLWNAWIFLINSEVFKEILEDKNPEIKKIIFDLNITDEEKFNKIETVSIDKWLIEKTNKLYCVNLDNFWTDLGTFDLIWKYSKEKNVSQTNIIFEWNTKNNFVLTETKTKEVCLVDVEDLIIIDSEDVLLISKKGSTKKVKKILEHTKKLIWNTWYRPWGYYKIINEWIGFKTKRLYVLPWKKMSLQSHNHRSEHWVVAEWTAKIHLWKKQTQEIETTLVPKWESIFVAIGQLHRIENPWLVPLVIIETQIWDYLWEDDIKRYEDDFWRE